MNRLLLLVSIFLWASPPIVMASTLSVVPVLIDVDIEARDSVTRDITVTNSTESKLDVYATINEVSVEDGEIKEFIEPGTTDRTTSITSWVEITRARIELVPGQTEVVPLTIKVHPQALPGNYYMKIGFVSASKRHEAEAVAMAGQAEGPLVKVTITEAQNELLRIGSFLIDRFILGDSDREISINLENTGDTAALPEGEIIFYNSLGEEVSALALGVMTDPIPAGEMRSVITEVPFDDKLGRYKANLVFRYGDNQQAAVFDTVQFYMIPLPVMVLLLVLIVLVSLIILYLIRRVSGTEHYEDDDGTTLPLYVRNDRKHQEKDHDITLTKN